MNDEDQRLIDTTLDECLILIERVGWEIRREASRPANSPLVEYDEARLAERHLMTDLRILQAHSSIPF